MVSAALRDALERATAFFTIFAEFLFFQANAMLADAAGSPIASWVDPNCGAYHGCSSTPIWQTALTHCTWAADIAGTVAALANSPYLCLGASDSHSGEYPTAYGRRESFQ